MKVAVRRLLSCAATLSLGAGLLAQPALAEACAVTGVQAYQPTSREVAAAMDAAAASRLGSEYPALPRLETGFPATGAVDAPVPSVLLKAIGYIEASWRQAAWSVPGGSAGPVKQSPSCGYGIMQITSGMRRPGELAPEVQRQIASDYRYNIAWAARLLAEKWNAGDSLNAVVGDRDPAIVDDWYYAVWAYNQFTFRNNPNNPAYPWPRPPYDGTQPEANYQFQELVWGLAAHPPTENGVPLWEPVPLSLPDRKAIGDTPGPIPAPAAGHASPAAALPPQTGNRVYLPYLPRRTASPIRGVTN